MPANKLKTLSAALLMLSLFGCSSKPPAQVCPQPVRLPAWVIEASKAPSSTVLLDRIISTSYETLP